MSLDQQVQVTISLDTPPITGAGFVTPLLTSRSLLAGFTERVREYAQGEAADDADLPAALVDQIETFFSQSPNRVPTVKVGRVEASVAQVTEFTVGGSDDGTYTITINGEDFTFVASGNTVSDIVAGLVAAFPGAQPVTAVDNDPIVEVTADVAGDPFTFAVSAPNDNITAATTTANVNMNTELGEIADEDNDWYFLAHETRTDADILYGAQYAEANGKFHLPQSDDADVLTSSTSDIASQLQTLSYARTGLLYKSDDTDYADAGWLGGKGGVDPDVASTVWSFFTIAGVAADSLTQGEVNNALGKNANLYTTFFGVGATGLGTMADGTKMDLRVTADVLKARVEERFAQLLLDYSNRGEKIPYTETGFQIFVDEVKAEVASKDERNMRSPHFVSETLEFDVPTLAEATASGDRAARIFRFSFEVEPAGAIESAVVQGFVTVAA